MSADVGEAQDNKGGAEESTHMHFVGGKSGRCADGVVEGLFKTVRGGGGDDPYALRWGKVR